MYLVYLLQFIMKFTMFEKNWWIGYRDVLKIPLILSFTIATLTQ